MLGVAICIAGVVAILLVAELLWRQNILRGELQRKFVHIVGGGFVAFFDDGAGDGLVESEFKKCGQKISSFMQHDRPAR